ncbi:unnamed protein product [Anisakis simplex]|uniref:Lipase (inferred by orthology to a C. elegans protein) n=1 Tax=Anisakis simplex TaxID=6269 RepID=A0A0M3K2U0_ANISI|nr:unnamed protein product [Anisakis simplex]
MIELVQYHGYPIEEHIATTTDGYHLLLHRIPFGVNENGKNKYHRRPVIFLQHGFVGSSATWVTNLPSQSAGFVFADSGFDVWMGNARGNTYSQEHNRFTRNDDEYWKFTFDQISKYDLETMIDKALNVSGQKQLSYVGYSEGCVTMLAKLAIDPAFSAKVSKFFALGPMTSMVHARGLVAFVLNHLKTPLQILSLLSTEFMSNFGFFGKLTRYLYTYPSMTAICDYLLLQIGGEITNQTRMSVYLTHIPGGTSTANLIHWTQLADTEHLRMFDFGTEQLNIFHYGTPKPPVYEFDRISTPTYIYWSDADWFTDERDIKNSIIDRMRPEYLVESNRLVNFNHFDYVWGVEAAEQIYKPIISRISGY